jgi:hypothetical protein
MKRVTLNFIIACVGLVLLLSLAAAGTILRYMCSGKSWELSILSDS